jgi:TATA-box binding protein (TBP) (component of TFIID and TFIIIB)
MTEFKISTVTMSTRFPGCTINLTNIGKYLDIDDIIIGIKYNYADLNVTKGSYTTTVYKKAKVKDCSKVNKFLFYNQITIILNNKGNHVNIKLFGNGSLHLTGCKTVREGEEATLLLYEKLCALKTKTDTILVTKDTNGVLVDKDNLVYSYDTKTNPGQIIGYVKNGVYHIHKKEFDIDSKTEMFISKKIETQRRRTLLNLNGEQIGYTQIELLKNKNKFYKKNVNIFYDTDNHLIYYNNDIIIGKIVYHYEKALITDKQSKDDIKEIEYSCNPFIGNTDYILQKPISEKVIDRNVNCINVCFTLNMDINRQRFYDELIKLDYMCKYKPESYSGIKLIYKVSAAVEIPDGYCRCTSKCTCTNITFLVFQSGKVIATGFKSEEQIGVICSKFVALCERLRNVIQKRVTTVD